MPVRLLHCVCLLLLAGLIGGALPLRAQDATALLQRGDSLLAAGQVEAAEDAYRAALDENGEGSDAHLGLARAAWLRADWSDMNDALKTVLAQDPANLAAHYYQGIRFREVAKVFPYHERAYRAVSDYQDRWTKGIDHFEFVLAHDSTYRDVLYQYALLWRYARQFDRALDLADAMVRRQPEQQEALQGLIAIYRSYLRERGYARAAEELAERSGPFAAFFEAEALRLAGDLDAADARFEALGPLPMPRQRVLLAQARIAYARDSTAAGQALVEQAVTAIATPIEAWAVFDDVKYIVTPAEWQAFQDIQAPVGYRTFFQRFWDRRDPLPAAPVNLRLAEHYRRLLLAEQDYPYYGFRTFLTDPEWGSATTFFATTSSDVLRTLPRAPDSSLPATHSLVPELNDKGIIYVRHGEPDDRAIPSHGQEDFTESWRYQTAGQPLDFHFAGTGGNWRLTTLPHLDINAMEQREQWGGVYAELAGRYRQRRRGPVAEIPGMEQRVLRRIAEDSIEDMAVGLTTDRHTWPDSVEGFGFPYLALAFRGEDGQTDLDIHYALPVGFFKNKQVADRDTLVIEQGCALHELDWAPVDEHLNRQVIPMNTRNRIVMTGSCHFTAAPDSYHVALHSRPQGTSLVGGYRFAQTLPDFRSPGLRMSGLLPALVIEPAARPSRFNKHTYYVPPNPLARYDRLKPLWLYYEVYNLTLDADDRTDYTIQYTLTKERRKILGLFGGDRIELTVRARHQGTEPTLYEAGQIDASRVDSGTYTLTVRITDEHTGATVERTQEIVLE